MDGSWGVTFVQRVFGPVMMMFATETHVCTSSICWSMQQQRANDTSQRLEIDIYMVVNGTLVRWGGEGGAWLYCACKIASHEVSVSLLDNPHFHTETGPPRWCACTPVVLETVRKCTSIDFRAVLTRTSMVQELLVCFADKGVCGYKNGK
jgi:hypothetical protein